jgi:hypothetical protein
MHKHGVSMHRQAVLIQDVLSFREYIKPYLDSIWEPFELSGFLFERAIAWIICELIWENTQNAVVGHNSSDSYRSAFYQLQNNMTHPTLFECFKHLIRVPKLYEYTELFVALDGRDLTIMYLIPQPLQFV